jgi:excisionase family DNA binding protein
MMNEYYDGLPEGITKDALVDYYESILVDEFVEVFTLADNSSQPFQWMILGVDMSILAESDNTIIAHVDGHVEVGIGEARDSERHGFGSLTDAQAMDAYKTHSTEYGRVLKYIRAAVEEYQIELALNEIITTSEAAERYNLDDSTPKKAAQEGAIPARKSGGTWLIRREDAEARWGKRK